MTLGGLVLLAMILRLVPVIFIPSHRRGGRFRRCHAGDKRA
jgi:hypothetical protein